MDGVKLKQQFIKDVKASVAPTHLVVAIHLPSGAKEIITNTQMLEDKINYYTDQYDESFCLRANPHVRIVNYMLV